MQPLLLLLAFLPQSPASVTQAESAHPAPTQERIVRDVRYATSEGVDAKSQSLDLYIPSGEGPHPIMVMVHGGGWRLGDKANRTMWKDKAPHFNREGWLYISINYRLSNGKGEPQHPAHVQDVAAALAWVHDHASDYRGDPERIFLMGHSAGAHLAALVATDARKLAKHDKTLQILKGVVCLDTAGYDIARYLGEDMAGRTARALYTNAFGFKPEAWKDASPQHFLGKKKNIPPMLIFHTKDRKEVAELSKAFVAGLSQINVPATAIYAADKSHAGINACIGQKGDPYTALIMQFLQEPAKVDQVRLFSHAPVQSLRPNGSVRLQFLVDSPEENLIPESWQLRIEVDGKHLYEIDYPKWTSRNAMLAILASVAEVESLTFEHTEDSGYIDLHANITRVTWQCKDQKHSESLEIRALPLPKRE